MDQKADFSDKQTNMDNGSKNACSQSMDVVTQPPHTNTEIQRSEYHQAQAETASTVVDETFRRLSLKEMDPLDQNRWSPKGLTIFQHPMWLISSKIEKNEAGKETKTLLKIEEEVFDQISKIDWPIVVVAVAGLSKTGKSYLMNRLAKSSKGFEVGDTIERTTKGIWAWCKIHPTQSNTVLLLLDTEGLGDNDKGDPSHDNKIFTLATLLCNCLVYNMKGTFDYDTVSKLTFVTEMASNIRFRGLSSKDNQSINLILPDFVLCLRDFTLKLMKDGKKISENEYLEQSLAEDENKTERFNKPRACIRNNFPRRECFAFPFPCNIDDLEKLETLSLNDLSARFQEVTTRFTSYIYTIPPKELLGSKPLNGQMFITLADHYVTAIKHGAVPDVDDAFEAVAKMENTKIAKKALKIFETEMEKEKLPVSEGNLWKRYTRAQGKSLHYLRQNAFHDFKAKCEIQAQRKMDTTWNKIKTINEQKIQEECEKTLKNVFEKYLVHNLKNREYETAGGHRRYKRDVERAKGEYVSVLREFKQTEIFYIWYGFVEYMTVTEAKIIEADENMKQKEKEAEQRRNQENLAVLVQQQQKAQEDAEKKQKKDLADHYEEQEKDRRKLQEAQKKTYEALVRERLGREAAEKEVERYILAQKAAVADVERYIKEREYARDEAARLRKQEEDRKQKWIGTRVWDAIWNE